MTVEEQNALLDKKIDATTTIRDATFTQFMGWCLNKLNNVPMFNPDVQEITGMAGGRLPNQTLPDEKKIELIQKLIKLGIEI